MKPSSSFARTSAPFSTSSRTTASWPPCAATMRAVTSSRWASSPVGSSPPSAIVWASWNDKNDDNGDNNNSETDAEHARMHQKMGWREAGDVNERPTEAKVGTRQTGHRSEEPGFNMRGLEVIDPHALTVSREDRYSTHMDRHGHRRTDTVLTWMDVDRHGHRRTGAKGGGELPAAQNPTYIVIIPMYKRTLISASSLAGFTLAQRWTGPPRLRSPYRVTKPNLKPTKNCTVLPYVCAWSRDSGLACSRT